MSSPSLPTLPSVKQLSKYVTRVLGQNPGKFTLQGTNTYLIHHPKSPRFILLDTAQGFPSYLPHLTSTIESHPVQPAYVSDIVLSHYHHDHVDGLESVLNRLEEIGAVEGRKGVRVWKFPAMGEEREQDERIEKLLDGIDENVVKTITEEEEGVEGISHRRRLRALKEGQKFQIDVNVDGEDETIELEVKSTPGHTTDSISLMLRTITTTCPSSSTSSTLTTTKRTTRRTFGLFSFDTVLGHGTAVFNNLTTYLNSLNLLITLLSSSSSNRQSTSQVSITDSNDGRSERDGEERNQIPIYPGHGEVIEDGLSKLREYKRHRLEREEQVVETLKRRSAGDVGRPISATTLTNLIYGTTIPDSLKPAATRGLLLHLEKLRHDGKIERIDATACEDDGEEGKVDWKGLGVSEKDVPKGWNDRWRLLSL